MHLRKLDEGFIFIGIDYDVWQRERERPEWELSLHYLCEKSIYSLWKKADLRID